MNRRFLVGGFSICVTFLVLAGIMSVRPINTSDSRYQPVGEVFEVATTTMLSLLDRSYTPIITQATEPSLTALLAELQPQVTGEVVLALDQDLQAVVYRVLEKVALSTGYTAGAGVVMDVETGELLALVSYSPTDPGFNNATHGLFIPGSIIKPFVGIAALAEGVVDASDEILSTGALEMFDSQGTRLLFKDWKPHGYVNMRTALGVSSNVYFYIIGGGDGGKPGLGIDTLLKYVRWFQIGNETGLELLTESKGRLPTPAWKREVYGDEWRLADTYLTAIGQHGYAVSPLHMTRAVAAIATKGVLVTPTILHADVSPPTVTNQLPIAAEYFLPVQSGMEYAVTNGTAAGLYHEGALLAVKTGTAEADANKEYIHSWVVGYFPASAPRYAFTIMLAHGPWGESVGAVAATADMMKWMKVYRSEYLSPR